MLTLATVTDWSYKTRSGLLSIMKDKFQSCIKNFGGGSTLLFAITCILSIKNLKGEVCDSAERLLTFEHRTKTNTSLPSLLLQKQGNTSSVFYVSLLSWCSSVPRGRECGVASMVLCNSCLSHAVCFPSTEAFH